MDENEAPRRPIRDVVGGVEVSPLPEGWTPLEAVLLVKCLDSDGHVSWAFRRSPGLNDEELLGVLTVRTDLLRRYLLECYETDSSDDDDA